MRDFLKIGVSSLIAAFIMGTAAAAVSTYTFYDSLFAPGYTDHQRGIAWFLVEAATLAVAALVLVIGCIYGVIKLCFRAGHAK